MRKLLLLSLIAVTLTSCGQDKVTFKIYFKPDKVYRTTMTTSSDTEVAETQTLGVIASGHFELET